jgi:hypothetical protein
MRISSIFLPFGFFDLADICRRPEIGAKNSIRLACAEAGPQQPAPNVWLLIASPPGFEWDEATHGTKDRFGCAGHLAEQIGKRSATSTIKTVH